MPAWIESAWNATQFQKNIHYHIENNKIIPIDVSDTGVLQRNTVWGDGLAQFLQLKEQLPPTAEGICTNFLSMPAYFKRYGNIYGLTGTLGN